MTPDQLSPHLRERVRAMGPPRRGEMVLYWMHHAVRGHDNPALDVACLAAVTLDLPLLVYQGLESRHPFDNTRHHTFIMQGARDAAAELEARGLRHCFRLGDEPVDLQRTDVAALCAECHIDRRVAAVPPEAAGGSTGGSAAGCARWRRFVDGSGLVRYGRLRNDAAVLPPLGVSRLSPYLHHGHVSALRIAREATAHGGSGAAKFLDELLVWRELAHNFCFHAALAGRDPGAFESLPTWARETLERHAGDPRPALPGTDALERARSGDPLWDAAQRSLLVYGELHNNVRMTWAKALLGWTPSARRALELMLTLNHRYALDGSDPNSYGGILHALGLFDRPFAPEQPVYGSVRTRSLAQHAQRLDVPRYRARVGARPGPRVAVVGAGIAGLAAAQALGDAGLEVCVFERGRSVGGRCAARRTAFGSFDHGAPGFHGDEPALQRWLAQWREAGVLGEWAARVARRDAHGALLPATTERRLVGLPDMRALPRHLAEGLTVRVESSVLGLRQRAQGWEVLLAGEQQALPFDAVLLAMPPEQALRLLPQASPLAPAARAARSAPRWSLMCAFARPLPVDFDALRLDGHALEWAVREGSKPRRRGEQRWVAHAGAAWSRPRLETPADSVAAQMLDLLLQALQLPHAEASHCVAHRWGLALPESAPGVDCIWDAASAVGLCGDWCRGGGIAQAFASGVAVAARVVAMPLSRAA